MLLPPSALYRLENLTLQLENCRAAPKTPVLQLHLAKTAGSSLCHWANGSGFRSLQSVGQMNRCQLLGDGPFWLGVPWSAALQFFFNGKMAST